MFYRLTNWTTSRETEESSLKRWHFMRTSENPWKQPRGKSQSYENENPSYYGSEVIIFQEDSWNMRKLRFYMQGPQFMRWNCHNLTRCQFPRIKYSCAVWHENIHQSFTQFCWLKLLLRLGPNGLMRTRKLSVCTNKTFECLIHTISEHWIQRTALWTGNTTQTCLFFFFSFLTNTRKAV